MTHATESDSPPPLRLRLRMPAVGVVAFSPLLQAGFFVTARVGCSVKTLLSGQFGIDEEYVTRRITTMFLDSRPVDKMESTLVRDGATLALSCAMPGLVGATLRRGGFYAPFRAGISCKDNDAPTRAGIGTVRIKLFNLLMGELGPLFLGRGIIVAASAMEELLRKSSQQFLASCSQVSVDAVPVEPAILANCELFKGREKVRLTVLFDPPVEIPEDDL
jgi:hypothetical protein